MYINKLSQASQVLITLILVPFILLFTILMMAMSALIIVGALIGAMMPI